MPLVRCTDSRYHDGIRTDALNPIFWLSIQIRALKKRIDGVPNDKSFLGRADSPRF